MLCEGTDSCVTEVTGSCRSQCCLWSPVTAVGSSTDPNPCPDHRSGPPSVRLPTSQAENLQDTDANVSHTPRLKTCSTRVLCTCTHQDSRRLKEEVGGERSYKDPGQIYEVVQEGRKARKVTCWSRMRSTEGAKTGGPKKIKR